VNNSVDSYLFPLKSHCPEHGVHDYPFSDHSYPPYHQDCWVRQEIIEIIQTLNFTTGAEIGVQRGHFAKIVLGIWTKATSYSLIDMWRQQPSNYSDKANVDDNAQEAIYQEALELKKTFGNVPKYFRNSSLEAAEYFLDGSLDFIYIDARHDYCGVMEDLHAWYPKLKVGGMMAGHDFLTAHESIRMSTAGGSRMPEHWEICMNGTIHWNAVKGAVVEFACKNRLHVHHTKDRPPSWYFSRKPPL
jgi:hypothetical protein